jgi:hypothetical protein
VFCETLRWPARDERSRAAASVTGRAALVARPDHCLTKICGVTEWIRRDR